MTDILLVDPIIEDDRPVQGDHGLAPEQIKRVIGLIRSGVMPKRAVASVGVNAAKFTRWKNKADKGIYPFAALFDDFELAEQAYLASCEQILSEAMADGDAAVALKVLERRDPGNYAPRTQTDINANFAITTDDMRSQLMAMLSGAALPAVEATDAGDLLLDPVNDYKRPEIEYGSDDDE